MSYTARLLNSSSPPTPNNRGVVLIPTSANFSWKNFQHALQESNTAKKSAKKTVESMFVLLTGQKPSEFSKKPTSAQKRSQKARPSMVAQLGGIFGGDGGVLGAVRTASAETGMPSAFDSSPTGRGGSPIGGIILRLLGLLRRTTNINFLRNLNKLLETRHIAFWWGSSKKWVVCLGEGGGANPVVSSRRFSIVFFENCQEVDIRGTLC